MLAVGNCCDVAVCSAAEGASAPTGEEWGGGGVGRGHTVAAAAYSLFVYQFNRSIFLRDYSRLSWYPGKISPEKNDADKMPQEK